MKEWPKKIYFPNTEKWAEIVNAYNERYCGSNDVVYEITEQFEEVNLEYLSDVPTQYKKVTDIAVNNLIKIAENLMPIILELSDNFRCESDNIIITIRSKNP